MPRTSVATNFYLVSFKRGSIPTTLNTADYDNLGDLLNKEHIDADSVVIEFKDKDGNMKSTEPATVITEGDSVRIANKSNKSG